MECSLLQTSITWQQANKYKTDGSQSFNCLDTILLLAECETPIEQKIFDYTV